MADEKNRLFDAKPELKLDKRLTEVFLRLGVLSKEDVKIRKSTLKDSESNLKRITFTDIISSQD